MNLLVKVFVIWLFFISMLSASEVSWTGKWQVHWSAGAFILTLDQNGSDVNGTYEPAHGTLMGKAQGNTLKASTVTERGMTNTLALTISANKKSFFGNTKYGEWVTGIRVGNEGKQNAVDVNQSTPLNAFYSF